MGRLLRFAAFCGMLGLGATSANADVCGEWYANEAEQFPQAAHVALSMNATSVARVALVSISGEGFIWQVRADGIVRAEFASVLPEFTMSVEITGRPVVVDVSAVSRLSVDDAPVSNEDPAIRSIIVYCSDTAVEQ
ncbi:hypothetical protein [Pelagibius sp. Alg239-R121]|uniref:hypothetical protein n=1 Tax=Pelagibius sp. Alg239-R121 TaxID=2993448 RepID=UPI0024A64723|nr:hypothetical protein [Pelagibius sp. Alg239-R121]